MQQPATVGLRFHQRKQEARRGSQDARNPKAANEVNTLGGEQKLVMVPSGSIARFFDYGAAE